MARNHLQCIIKSDMTAVIHDNDKIIFQDTLQKTLQYALENNYILDLLFDYNAAYIYSKILPEHTNIKDRKYWELYNSQTLFMNNELIYVSSKAKYTSWITAGDVKELFQQYKNIIHNTSWKALTLLDQLQQQYPVNTGMYIYYIQDLKQYICLGIVQEQLITARLLHHNKVTLLADIRETAVHLQQFHKQDECSIKYIHPEHIDTFTDTVIDNWIHIEHLAYQQIDLTQQIPDALHIPFLEKTYLQKYLYHALGTGVIIAILLQLYTWNIQQDTRYYSQQITQIQMQINQKYRVQTSISLNTIGQIQTLLKETQISNKQTKTYSQILQHLYALITSYQYTSRQSNLVLVTGKQQTYQNMMAFMQTLQNILFKYTVHQNVNIKHQIQKTKIKYNIKINH